jgi:hypothetical protein
VPDGIAVGVNIEPFTTPSVGQYIFVDEILSALQDIWRWKQGVPLEPTYPMIHLTIYTFTNKHK